MGSEMCIRDSYPAGGQEPVPLAGPQRGPQGAGTTAGDVDRSRAAKQRILEIYLNIAELGPSGQFGAEAGSIYAFGRSAATLSPREAALLAAILPNPVRRSARNPGPGVRRLAGTYMARAGAVQRCWSENRAF